MNIVLCTCPAERSAAIARQIVEERHAACCNRLPGVESVYWWEGQLETAREDLLVFKAPSTNVPALTRRLAQLHPYELPEILALPVSAGLEAYLAWVGREARPAGS